MDVKDLVLKMIKEVARDNFFEDKLEKYKLGKEELLAILREANSRCALGLLPFKEATLVILQDGDPVLYLYKEIESDDERGLYGFGYAFNIYHPDFSEWGYLFTPRKR